MVVGVFIVLCSVIFGSVVTNVEYTVEGTEESPTNNETEIAFHNADEPSMVVRKCCPVDTYFWTLTSECVVLNDTSIFDNTIIELLLNSENKSFALASAKLGDCPGTLISVKVKGISTNSTHSLLEDGSIHDYEEGVSYNHSNYCLELTEHDIESSTLTVVYCFKSLHKTVPKCCPENNFFDYTFRNCSSYYGDEDDEGDSMLLPFFEEDTHITYEGSFGCEGFLMTIRLDEAVIHDRTLCVNSSSKNCYNAYEFCVDNVLKKNESKVVQLALVCPDNFIKKCCPDGFSLHANGCEETQEQSAGLVHILRDGYQAKILSQLESQCTTITIEHNAKSNMNWTINSAGFAEILNRNETIRTNNFCIDDFSINGTVSPVIKVCSGDVFIEHPPVSTIENVSENLLSKCCPSNMVYYRSSSTDHNFVCIWKPREMTELSEEKNKFHYNFSHLLTNDAQRPKCHTIGDFHQYNLGPADDDYAEVTANWHLNIVRKDNKCVVRSTEIDGSKFCIDQVMDGDTLKAMAFVCVPSNEDYHPERNAIIVTLIGVSCVALISTFFSLIFVRVRRGIFTVRKMSTLAGRIQASYVVSMLVAYIVIAVGALVEFKEDAGRKCFVLTGFLIFFMMAAFCWNSSICLEGLLLTLHIQVPDCTRYLCHSLWAWGVPGALTAFTLVMDSYRDDLPCDAIVPKIGVDRCFFSDPVAQLLYFYVPISATVVANGALLTAAKMLRRKQLRCLEKNSNRIRKQWQLRAEPSQSGLRTHQNKNMWLESLRLVLWSGTTWLMEIIGTLVTMKDGQSRGEWYNYMWYLPVGFNCLRGLGISYVILVTPDNKLAFLRFARNISSRINETAIAKLASSTSIRLRSSIGGRSENLSSTSRSREGETGDRTASSRRADHGEGDQTRSISVSTIVTDISSCTVDDQPDSPQPNPEFYHSVSQLDSRNKLPEVFECYEGNADIRDKQLQELDREDADKTSLDNTSTENMFRDNELPGKLAQQESQKRHCVQVDTSFDNASRFSNPTSGTGDTQNESAEVCTVTTPKGSTVSNPASDAEDAKVPHDTKCHEDFDDSSRL